MEHQNSAKRRRADDSTIVGNNRSRLRKLISEGSLVHPLEDGKFSFADLAHSLALCCGLAPERPIREEQAAKLAADIGGTSRRHVVIVLCDGMGSDLLEHHLDPQSFLRVQNDRNRLLAIFPATTPAALTTLATGAWPGQHGLPGWELRDQKGCEFPKEAGPGPVQLTILDSCVKDMRSNRPAAEVGFDKYEDIYVAPPWTSLGDSMRKMKFVNAYNGTAFTEWYQSRHSQSTATIQETTAETLGMPEGSEKAVEYLNHGVDLILNSVEDAEREGWKSYLYLYTAHPDKHMHALGTEHPEVRNVIRGINAALERLWDGLKNKDSAMIVTADHGHVTVQPSDMVSLPDDILDCLEYANIGVHGKGRHACLHCRSGRHAELEELWATNHALHEKFILLTVEAAVEEGLFGPDPPLPKVRPRLGDFLVISVGSHTLVSPADASKFRDCAQPKCQGAHGSLLPAELQIPFVLCTSEAKAAQIV